MSDELRAWAETVTGEEGLSFEPIPDAMLVTHFRKTFAELSGHDAPVDVEIASCPG